MEFLKYLMLAVSAVSKLGITKLAGFDSRRQYSNFSPTGASVTGAPLLPSTYSVCTVSSNFGILRHDFSAFSDLLYLFKIASLFVDLDIDSSALLFVLCQCGVTFIFFKVNI